MVKKTKKTSRPIKIRGGSGTQVFDLDRFNAIYDKWKQDCEAKGTKLGLTSDVSLLELVKGHGVVARPYTKNAVSRDKGAGTILEMMDEWENDIAILEIVDTIALDEIIEKLTDMADSENDPRNIRFTVPKPSEVDDLITEMIRVKGPVICDVQVDPTENCFPMIPSGSTHNQMLLGPNDKVDGEISEEGMVLV